MQELDGVKQEPESPHTPPPLPSSPNASHEMMDIEVGATEVVVQPIKEEGNEEEEEEVCVLNVKVYHY